MFNEISKSSPANLPGKGWLWFNEGWQRAIEAHQDREANQ
jgi:hypothetical protein